MTDNALSRAERLTSEHSFELLYPPVEAAQAEVFCRTAR